MSFEKKQNISSLGEHEPLMANVETNYQSIQNSAVTSSSIQNEINLSVKSKSRKPYLPVDLKAHKQYMMDKQGRHYYDTYHRYKYYQKLAKSFYVDPSTMHPQTNNFNQYQPLFHIIPDHIIPAELFLVANPAAVSSNFFKRLITIFSLWNTMVGSSMLAMPWAFSQAGYVGGSLCIVGFGCISFFTCYLMLRASYRLKAYLRTSELPDFCDVCGHYMGLNIGYRGSLCVSVFLLLAACIVFWILMTSYLYDSVVSFLFIFSPTNLGSTNLSTRADIRCPAVYHCQFAEGVGRNVSVLTDGSSIKIPSWWNENRTVPLILSLIIFPIISIRSPKFFSRLNCLGTVSIITISLFVTQKLVTCWRDIPVDAPHSTENILVPFSSNFPKLTGILALALLIHNAFLPVLNLNPSRPLRAMAQDLGAAYALATITYLYVGATFYAGFVVLAGGGSYSCPLADNFLKNVSTNDPFTVVVRALLLFQMLTVFPLVTYLFRLQAKLLASVPESALTLIDSDDNVATPFVPITARPFEGNEDTTLLLPPVVDPRNLSRKGKIVDVALNVIIVLVCVAFAICLPHIGLILRFAGGFCGFIYIFFLPNLVWAASLRSQHSLSAIKLGFILTLVAFGCSNFVSQFFYP